MPKNIKLIITSDSNSEQEKETNQTNALVNLDHHDISPDSQREPSYTGVNFSMGEITKPLGIEAMNHNVFAKFCEERKFFGFSFPAILTENKNGECKKILPKGSIPKWGNFTAASCNKFIKKEHKAFAIKTGEISGVTVIDCDSPEAYISIINDYPELAFTFSVKTARGFHIYCKYEVGITTNSHSFVSYPDVDIRNDNGLAFAPPSTYRNCITLRDEVYTISNPTKNLIPFPEGLKADLKQFASLSVADKKASKRKEIENVESSDKLKPENLNSLLPENKTIVTAKYNGITVSKEENINNNNQSSNYIDNGIQTGNEPLAIENANGKEDLKFEEIDELLNVLPPSYFDGYMNWFKIGAIIFEELGDNILSKNFFLTHSKRSPVYVDKVEIIDIDKIWHSFIVGKPNKATKRSLYALCKEFNETRFNEIKTKYHDGSHLVSFDFFQINSTTLAKHFVWMYGDDFIQNNKMGNLYYWNGNIWSSQIAEQRVLQLIGNDFYNELVKMWIQICNSKQNTRQNNENDAKSTNNELDSKNKDTILKILSKLQKREYKMSVFKDILTELPIQNVDFDTNIEQLNNLQFQNGILMLDKVKWNHSPAPFNTSEVIGINIENAFRNRDKCDYVTLVLPYNFEIPKKQDVDFVQNIFNQIQPDSLQRDFQLGWLAYCLTGNTGEQIFKLGIGYSGSNGKSLEAKIHSTCFDIYSFKLNKNTFTEGNEKAHKQFIHLISEPIRYAYIEELNRKKIDAEALKDVVDGHKLNVEIMYGTSQQKAIQAKISTFSNTDFKIAPDGGILRRGRLQYYPSEFIDPESQKPGESKKPNQYPLIKDLEKQFLKNEMKLAYLWVLLPYVSKFFANGLIVPEVAKTNFSSITVEYDDLSNALEEICIKGDDIDKIWKNDLIEQLGLQMNKTLIWENILPEMKRLGYIYKKDTRTKSLSGTLSCKGCIVGLKWNPEHRRVTQINFLDGND